MEYPVLFIELINSFKKLPGIGSKSAERMAYEVLKMKQEDVEKFATSLLNVLKINRCPVCGNLTDEGLCDICADNTRDTSVICVVHSTKDIFALEKMKEYNGLYHVLNGYISPQDASSIDNLNINKLIERINSQNVKEVIMATDLTVEGEITAMYISKLLEKKCNGVKVTRLAHGLPTGATIDYSDELTLFKAFSNRKEIK